MLCTAFVRKSDDDNTYLIATNGYVAVKLFAPELSDHIGKYVKRDSLVRWMKLAATRDILKGEEIIEMFGKEDIATFPALDHLITDLTPTPSSEVVVNPKFLVNMEQLADQPLKWTMHGGTNPFIARSNKDVYIVMPLKA